MDSGFVSFAVSLACAIPGWLASLIGLAATVLLAIPAWRIDRSLSRIHRANPPPDGAPETGAKKKTKIQRLKESWADNFKKVVEQWNSTHSVLFRLGVALAVVAAFMVLVGSLCDRRGGADCTAPAAKLGVTADLDRR